MTVTHLKKKDVVKSKVRGVDLEFDNEKSATILGRRVQSSRDETFSKVYSFSGNEKCDTSIWEKRHLKLHGFDIYGSLNGKEVSQSAKSDDETHELCDLHEGSRVASMEIGSL
ncbi:hypothetical protein Dimus_036160 [Dionaea muscipula]